MSRIDGVADACIVSCDIVAHGSERDHERQLKRLQDINQRVREPVQLHGNRVVWASGGDGGHVAFLEDRLLPDVLRLAASLLEWSQENDVPLRITIHRGEVSCFEGADGRAQLVGSGINLCGSLVNFGFPHAIVVTDEFRIFVEKRHGMDLSHLGELKFVRERTVYLKHFAAHRLSLLSFHGEAPEWVLERSDHRKLEEVGDHHWQAMYHVKRLLQVNSQDEAAQRALDRLEPRKLPCGREAGAHPLFALVSGSILGQVLAESQLVEREDGDVICERGEPGDAMFIVLRGEVGVVTQRRGHGEADGADHKPADIRFTEGEIVGELAFGLSRKRTATLQAIGSTALLAINYENYKRLLDGTGGPRLSLAFSTLLGQRILEHMYRTLPYLSLELTDQEKERDPRPWKRLEDDSELISLTPREAHDISPQKKTEFRPPGLYILAGGQLVEKSESPKARKTLNGEHFDILFANLPQSIVTANHEYKLDPEGDGERVTVLRITEEALLGFARRRYHSLIERIKARLSEQMLFDVFISYAFEDETRAKHWKQQFEAAGLSVYMSEPQPMHKFADEINVALSEARVFVPIISKHSVRSKWVTDEIRRRRQIFETNPNVLSMALEDALAEKAASGISSLTAGELGSEPEKRALDHAISMVQKVKRGEGPFPLSIQAD